KKTYATGMVVRRPPHPPTARLDCGIMSRMERAPWEWMCSVIGRPPAGRYFRRSVWGWRPLAQLVTTLCPKQSSACRYCQEEIEMNFRCASRFAWSWHRHTQVCRQEERTSWVAADAGGPVSYREYAEAAQLY